MASKAVSAQAKQAMGAKSHALRALEKWPKDTLRPEIQLRDALRKQLEQGKQNSSETEQLRQANALYSLLDDRYSKKYPTGNLLKPRSRPTHFQDLLRELEEAPSRSWLQRVMLRIKGAVRVE